MSMKLDAAVRNVGTRFRLFPQPRYLKSFRKTETVWVSVPPSQIEKGPADDRMYVVDAVHKLPYEDGGPPYLGSKNPPVKPGTDGHFDHLDVDSREFSCATMYATVRRVLDIWEDYFGHRIEWSFEADLPRLEMIPLIEWDNAQSGYGFLEFGYGRRPAGGIDYRRPYCQNFDVLAHELGHSIIFSEVGVPDNQDDEAIDYGGMQESSGDLVAIVSSLHFDSVVRHLLDSTKGNLFTLNELDRVGELSNSREIRVAFNDFRMSDVGDEPHERSLPLTGAVFDVMVEVFQKELIARKLISSELAERSTHGLGRGEEIGAIQKGFDAAYRGHAKGFGEALLTARDYLGELLATVWGSLSPNYLTYHAIRRAILRADRRVSGGKHQQTIRECFAWREIAPPATSMLLKVFRVEDCAPGSTAARVEAAHRESTVRQPARKSRPGMQATVVRRTGAGVAGHAS